MRTLSARRGPQHDEEESVFVSMTDMTVSFLFIIMILLAFFASRFKAEETVPATVYEPVRAERDTLREALDLMGERLAAAQAEIVDLIGQRTVLRETLSLAEIERDAALEILVDRNARIDELESELATIVSERDTLLLSVADLEDRLAVALSRIEALRAALTLAETGRDAALDMLAERDARVDALESELAAALSERDVLLRSVADLKDRLSAALARIEALRAALATVETERDATLEMLSDRSNRIRELEAEIEALSAELARLSRPDPLEAYIARVAVEREKVLERLRDALLADFPELEGVITSESDVLRFQGEGLFASGSDGLLAARIPIVERIAERLDALLPCYTLGARAAYSAQCNPAFAVIEAVQVEGHTDSDGADAPNVALSARRGAATYAAMTAHRPDLIAHRNLAGQPVLSIAGYGEGRPVIDNTTAQGKATNRRIDLRFIMVTPGESTEIGLIRERLRGAGDEP